MLSKFKRTPNVRTTATYNGMFQDSTVETLESVFLNSITLGYMYILFLEWGNSVGEFLRIYRMLHSS